MTRLGSCKGRNDLRTGRREEQFLAGAGHGYIHDISLFAIDKRLVALQFHESIKIRRYQYARPFQALGLVYASSSITVHSRGASSWPCK
jgi:hypothetical protein